MSHNLPNILMIVMDHLSPRVIGACGSQRSCTPNIDALASDSCVNFTNMYASCPLCQPSRTSFWTGLLPHQTGVLSNGGKNSPRTEDVISPKLHTIGSLLADAGYRTMHFGKCHDAGSLRGFNIADTSQTNVPRQHDAWNYNSDTFHDRYTTDQCVQFYSDLPDRCVEPHMVVADLNNPHNICGWVGDNSGEHEDMPIPGELPPLPDNFEHSDWSSVPLPIQYICCSHRRLAQAARWTPNNYRHYIAAYEHYTRVGDAMVGEILAAASARADWDNTIVILTADHGDGMASHRMVTKQVNFYDEITKVPFIVAGSGLNRTSRLDITQLTSLLDLLPTLCEFANVKTPKNPDGPAAGESLLPLIKGEQTASKREFVISQWHTEWGYTISPGRMLRSDGYKYTRYLEGDGEELYDMTADPGETINLARTPASQAQLKKHRQWMDQYIKATRDPFNSLAVKADRRWRQHECGYWNHQGPCAPSAVEK